MTEIEQLWEGNRHGQKDQRINYGLGWHSSPHILDCFILNTRNPNYDWGCVEKKVHFDKNPIKRTINWALTTYKSLCLMILRRQE